MVLTDWPNAGPSRERIEDPELGPIEDVEHLGAEPDIETLRNRKYLADRQVQIVNA